MVTSGAWRWGGYNVFGLSLLPLLLGIGLLFVNGRSLAGWLLTGAGAVIIGVGILAHLEITFAPPACSIRCSCWSFSSVASAWSPGLYGRRKHTLQEKSSMLVFGHVGLTIGLARVLSRERRTPGRRCCHAA